MSGKGSKNHIHKYFRSTDNNLWFCGLPNCSHFMPKNMPLAVMIGRESICWECNKIFELSVQSIERIQPLCDKCLEQLKKTEEFLREKGLL